MAILISKTDVKKLIETKLGDGDSETLDEFITPAVLVVEEELADSGLSQSRLQQIALYLSAHFLSLRVRQAAFEKIGETSISYQGKTGKGYQSSHFGQTAMNLDTTGTLKSLDGKMKAVMDFI